MFFSNIDRFKETKVEEVQPDADLFPDYYYPASVVSAYHGGPKMVKPWVDASAANVPHGKHHGKHRHHQAVEDGSVTDTLPGPGAYNISRNFISKHKGKSIVSRKEIGGIFQGINKKQPGPGEYDVSKGYSPLIKKSFNQQAQKFKPKLPTKIKPSQQHPTRVIPFKLNEKVSRVIKTPFATNRKNVPPPASAQLNKEYFATRKGSTLVGLDSPAQSPRTLRSPHGMNSASSPINNNRALELTYGTPIKPNNMNEMKNDKENNRYDNTFVSPAAIDFSHMTGSLSEVMKSTSNNLMNSIGSPGLTFTEEQRQAFQHSMDDMHLTKRVESLRSPSVDSYNQQLQDIQKMVEESMREAFAEQERVERAYGHIPMPELPEVDDSIGNGSVKNTNEKVESAMIGADGMAYGIALQGQGGTPQKSPEKRCLKTPEAFRKSESPVRDTRNASSSSPRRIGSASPSTGRSRSPAPHLNLYGQTGITDEQWNFITSTLSKPSSRQRSADSGSGRDSPQVPLLKPSRPVFNMQRPASADRRVPISFRTTKSYEENIREPQIVMAEMRSSLEQLKEMAITVTSPMGNTERFLSKKTKNGEGSREGQTPPRKGSPLVTRGKDMQDNEGISEEKAGEPHIRGRMAGALGKFQAKEGGSRSGSRSRSRRSRGRSRGKKKDSTSREKESEINVLF